MRKTLRRSCDACVKSKLRCDLLTPQCSRCSKKTITCVYANQPLSSPPTEGTTALSTRPPSESDDPVVQLIVIPAVLHVNPGIQAFDPFDSYPQTRLPRAHVQQLIQHFLSTIAFQYYPLDLSVTSNPFVVSWWPLALADPALFHVSLQTASLDVELRARKGFPNSDVLMADSVSLVRLKIEDSVMAAQDETIDSVVTLAAIEFGKGNVAVSKMHIDGIKSIIKMRGGIQQVKLTNPLTARMVSWVSIIILKSPQFVTQDHIGAGDGIAPIPQWLEVTTRLKDHATPLFDNLDLDPAIYDILLRLRNLLHGSQRFDLSTTDLHDLTCFVLHKLLAYDDVSEASSTSECVRCATALFILIIHGPTYFSHAHLQHNLTVQLKTNLEESLEALLLSYNPLAVWLLSIGMAASRDTPESHWFTEQARIAARFLHLFSWDHVLHCLMEILWLKTSHVEHLFREQWDKIWASTNIST